MTLHLRHLRAPAFAISLIVPACGSDSNKRQTVPTEAGVDAASGGGGGGGTGGRTTGAGGGLNTGGTSGSGGTKESDGAAGAVVDASADSSVSSADSGSDGGQLACAGPTTDSEGQWFDLAANTCQTCPATAPTCDDFLAGAGATYDPGTQIVTFHFKPGINQLLNGTFHTGYSYTNPSNISMPGSLDDLPAVVSGNTVRVNLSGLLPANTTNFYGGILSLTDACGAPVTTYNPNTDCLVFSMSQYSTDAGIWKVICQNNCT